VTPAYPRNLTSVVFRALYPDYELMTLGVLHIVTPKGTPVFIGDSLGQIARQLSGHPTPARTMPGCRHRPPGTAPLDPG
jgi:hypothetical protein